MTYTTIPDGDIDPDSPITTDLMTKLRDNPIAIANGDTGAPEVQTAGIADAAVTAAKLANDSVDQNKIATAAVSTSEIQDGSVTQTEVAAAAVGRGELKTAVVTLSGTILDQQVLNVTLNGYAFMPMMHSNPALNLITNITDLADPDTPTIGIANNSGGSADYDFDYRYVLA